MYDRVPGPSSVAGGPVGRAGSGDYVPNFLHIMAANRMAETAAHWASLMSERASAVSTQYLVVDYNIFESGREVPKGVFWLLERTPGLSEKQDLTELLLTGKKSFASFDRPWFPRTRQRLGHEAARRKYGDLYTLDRSPRGQIFGLFETQIEGLLRLWSAKNLSVLSCGGVLCNKNSGGRREDEGGEDGRDQNGLGPGGGGGTRGDHTFNRREVGNG